MHWSTIKPSWPAQPPALLCLFNSTGISLSWDNSWAVSSQAGQNKLAVDLCSFNSETGHPLAYLSCSGLSRSQLKLHCSGCLVLTLEPSHFSLFLSSLNIENHFLFILSIDMFSLMDQDFFLFFFTCSGYAAIFNFLKLFDDFILILL